jgi:hypothetical protein
MSAPTVHGNEPAPLLRDLSARPMLQHAATASLRPRHAQEAYNHGLFDLPARDQLDLFAPETRP